MMKKLSLFVFSIVAFMGGNCQVDLTSGAATQQFPLINYTDAKSGLSLQVGAGYFSGNGLAVQEVASDLGTGWSLQAGGMIRRAQLDQPDDQQAYVGPPSQSAAALGAPNSYPDGFLYSGVPNGQCPQGRGKYPLFRHANTLYKAPNATDRDMEQDRFDFNFNGNSGSFVISKDRKVHTLGDSRLIVGFS
ncbi:MAG: hypothetical protein EOP04_14110, partial [Proteobacteria bacterium]